MAPYRRAAGGALLGSLRRSHRDPGEDIMSLEMELAAAAVLPPTGMTIGELLR